MTDILNWASNLQKEQVINSHRESIDGAHAIKSFAVTSRTAHHARNKSQVVNTFQDVSNRFTASNAFSQKSQTKRDLQKRNTFLKKNEEEEQQKSIFAECQKLIELRKKKIHNTKLDKLFDGKLQTEETVQLLQQQQPLPQRYYQQQDRRMSGVSASTKSVQNRGLAKRISLENCFDNNDQYQRKHNTSRNSSIVFGSAHDTKETQQPNFSMTKQISVLDGPVSKRFRKSTNSLRSRLGQSFDFATDGNTRFQSVLSKQSVGYLVRPTFQQFQGQNRKYKGNIQPKLEDSQLPNFIANRKYNDPRETEISRDGSLMMGDPVFTTQSGQLPSLELPKCFEFTKRQQLSVLRRYLGATETSKIRTFSDVPELMTNRIQKAMDKMQNQQRKEFLNAEKQKLIDQINQITEQTDVSLELPSAAATPSEKKSIADTPSDQQIKVGRALFIQRSEMEMPRKKYEKVLYESIKQKLIKQKLEEKLAKLEATDLDELELPGKGSKEQEFEILQNNNFQRNMKQIKKQSKTYQDRAEDFTKRKMDVLADASQFVKNVEVKISQKQQLRWLKEYLRELQTKNQIAREREWIKEKETELGLTNQFHSFADDDESIIM